MPGKRNRSIEENAVAAAEQEPRRDYTNEQLLARFFELGCPGASIYAPPQNRHPVAVNNRALQPEVDGDSAMYLENTGPSP